MVIADCVATVPGDANSKLDLGDVIDVEVLLFVFHAVYTPRVAVALSMISQAFFISVAVIFAVIDAFASVAAFAIPVRHAPTDTAKSEIVTGNYFWCCCLCNLFLPRSSRILAAAACRCRVLYLEEAIDP